MEKALDYVRQNVDLGYVNYLVSKAKENAMPHGEFRPSFY